MRLFDNPVEAISKYFRLENEIIHREPEGLVLVSKSYFKDKCIFTHELSLQKIIDEAKTQIISEIEDSKTSD